MKLFLTEKSPEELSERDRKSKSLLKKIEELLILDGWKKLNKEIDKQEVLIFDDTGTISLRYLEWGWDYSEWHGRTFYYPVFYTVNCGGDNLDHLDEMIDNTMLLLIADSIPKLTENTKQAYNLLEEYWALLDEKNHDN